MRLIRLLRLALHVLEGLATLAVVFPFLGSGPRSRLVRRWARGVLRIANIRLHVRGAIPPAGTASVVFVANHVSWLDPMLILALYPAHFVAKAEVQSWPLLGWLAKKAGTLFIERQKRHDTARIAKTLAEALHVGEAVGLFPEGTTTDGRDVKPFHASLFEAAVLAEATVQPLALRYHHVDGRLDTAPAYTGDTRFVDSLWRILGQHEVHATVVFTDPIPARGRHRRELAAAAEAAIRAALTRCG